MKVVLLKDHIHEGVRYNKGEEIEVDKPTYDFIMSQYMAERIEQVKKEAEAKAILDVLDAPVPPRKKMQQKVNDVVTKLPLENKA